jgi:DNA-binding response OmpR family regulator
VARVLVVEDDPEIRDLIALRLLMAGHSVIAIRTAAGALDTVHRVGAPDVYVLDVGLPDIDGFQLLGRLRAAGEDAPALFLSAHARPRQVGLGVAMGARYLTKPFMAKVLIDAVTEALAAEPVMETEHSS